MRKIKKILTCISFLILLSNCATVKMEHNGIPLPDNILNARLLDGNITITSAVIEQYGIIEGDEILETYRYLDFNRTNYLNSNYIKSIKVVIGIYNPEKKEYKLWIEKNIGLNKEIPEYEYHLEYTGNLSRKDVEIILPSQKGTYGTFKFLIKNEKNTLLYQSFVLKYKVHKQ